MFLNPLLQDLVKRCNRIWYYSFTISSEGLRKVATLTKDAIGYGTILLTFLVKADIHDAIILQIQKGLFLIF